MTFHLWLALIAGVILFTIGYAWKSAFYRGMLLMLVGLILIIVPGACLLALWVMQ